MVSYKYMIDGEPMLHIQSSQGKQKMWTTYQQNKVRYSISVENQHNSRPLLEGPLFLELYFFQKEEWEKNELSCYVRFVEHIFTDVAYPSYQNIVSVSAKRCYTTEKPYTLVIISEIEEE